MKLKQKLNTIMLYMGAALASTALGLGVNECISTYNLYTVKLNNAGFGTKPLGYWRECKAVSLRGYVPELGLKSYYFSCKWEV